MGLTFLTTQNRRALLAKRFGANVTKVELLLHSRLAKEGFRFVSQWRIKTKNGNFTVDFLVTGWRNIDCQLVVEVDGPSHLGETAERKDAFKNNELKNAGFKVIRFKNRQVVKNLDEVIEKIRNAVVGDG